ncbi:hypothetical protein [Streptomyces aurantiogriseus]|uniref:Uncharacterized protein n=1 Tax=Streptomyces aurantiogriseus TaxID=66870 RepID=A0A918FFI7_9ACTN|nr:hypothetical protein [Streptomyces aurantiogriseus]GGR34850.1 hypothetical protein GCM10010251_58850 [Streptomyces aurantiogriseus]
MNTSVDPGTRAGKKQYYRNGMHVPYVTAWTAEFVPQPKIVRIVGRGGEGIGYEDEDPVTDRRHEALWVRSGLARGRGEPDFRRINTHRQKRAMRYSLCQVCEEPVLDPNAEERTLHLLGTDTPIAEGETTSAPPVHPLCAIESIENCPPLGRGWAAALVDYSPLWGVAGVVYDPVTLDPLPSPGRRPNDLTHVHVSDKRIRWTLANFTVVSLHGVTPVSPDELHAMAEADERRAGAP